MAWLAIWLKIAGSSGDQFFLWDWSDRTEFVIMLQKSRSRNEESRAKYRVSRGGTRNRFMQAYT